MIKFPLLLQVVFFAFACTSNDSDVNIDEGNSAVKEIPIEEAKRTALQDGKISVLCVGNSYTYYNGMPREITRIANNTTNLNTHFSNQSASGGMQLVAHAQGTKNTKDLEGNTTSTTPDKISSQSWDFVVIQGQSQELSFDSADAVGALTAGIELIDLIKKNHSKPAVFMTWGYRDGDNSNNRSYAKMTSNIRKNYLELAENTNAIVVPVGAVWNYMRTKYPAVELYDYDLRNNNKGNRVMDGSHPGYYGSYLIALTMYSVLFQEDPTNVTYTTSHFDTPDEKVYAQKINEAVKAVAFDSIQKWYKYYKPLNEIKEN